MNVHEARYRRNYRRPDIDPITAGADEPDFSDAQMGELVNKVFSLGWERKKQLDAAEDESNALITNSSGDYFIKYAHAGQYADFTEQANHEYLKKKYPWLHASCDGIGIDVSEAEDSHGELEKYLASIPEEDWQSFIEELAEFGEYPDLDSDRASELEIEEQGRWMTEDGGPDLIKAMIEASEDGYESFLLSKVTPDLVWEWCRETDHYPESQGDGSVYMRMDDYGKQAETREWFLDQLEDQVPLWVAEKRKCYDQMTRDTPHGLGVRKVGDLFDDMLRTLASEDEGAAHTYNRLDAASLWELFLQAFPDERREADDPYWYQWKANYQAPEEWVVGFEPDYAKAGSLAHWAAGYHEALAQLKDTPWFRRLVQNWFKRGPDEHPELKFEHLNEAEALNPDDAPEQVIGFPGLRESIVYEDALIVVFYPRDVETLNYHLHQMGVRDITKDEYAKLWAGNRHDVFIVLAKEKPDLLGKVTQKEVGVLVGDSERLVGFQGNYSAANLNGLLGDPVYGHSVRRMLLRYYREQVSADSSYALLLLQLGGALELRRAERKGHLNIRDYGVELGLYYVDCHKYRLAAKAFERPLNTLTPTGVWLIYDGVEDLLPVFKNEDAASTVFANDHHDWFAHYWEEGNRPDVSDVTKFLSPAAIAHIREILVNRRVWFPDGGPDGEGEYVLLRKKLLDGYDDETILEWIEKPSDQDMEDGVFDDIREAIQNTGIQLLAGASQDEVYTGFIKAAVEAIDGQQHRWGKHPTKATKYGPNDTFEVSVPWSSVKTWASDYRENNSGTYDGSLEELAVDMNRDTIEPDYNNMEASWRDIDKAYAAEQMDRILELEAPELEPLPDDRKQLQLPLGEGEAEEEAHAQALMREHGVDKPDYDLAAAEKKADERGDTQFRKRQVAQAYLSKLRGESVDPDADLDVARYVDDLDWQSVLRRNGFREQNIGGLRLEKVIGGKLYSVGESSDPAKLFVVTYYRTNVNRWQNENMVAVPKGQIWQWFNSNVNLRLEALDPDAPEAMSGLLSGVPAELETQIKAILQDSMEAHDYTASGLNLRLEPYWPPSEEEVDASDGRLTAMPPHFNLYVTYQVAAGPTYSYDEWPSQDHMAYTKVRGAVINTMRWLVLGESFALNPNALDLADDWVVFVFILFPRPKLAPPTPDEEIPF